jgi:hypothetical protein
MMERHLVRAEQLLKVGHGGVRTPLSEDRARGVELLRLPAPFGLREQQHNS